MTTDDLSQLSMTDLFRMEAQEQCQLLTAGLLLLERQPGAAEQHVTCMRAAHSLKGAAGIVGLTAGVGVAHAMEDCFVAAQQGRTRLQKAQIDLLLQGVDLLLHIADTAESRMQAWSDPNAPEVRAFVAALTRADGTETAAPALSPVSASLSDAEPAHAAAAGAPEPGDRVLRVTAQNLNRLLGLAGESLVESRWLQSFTEALLRLKRQQQQAGKALDGLRESLIGQQVDTHVLTALSEARRQLIGCQQFLAQRLVELDMFDRRAISVSHRLYDEALACRMRPFADGVQAFPRMVRDIAHSLGKRACLDIVGETTQVDRDVLEKLEAPLAHLLRNAIDHGIEPAAEREAMDKPAEATIRLEARHSAGMLQISVSDDGPGIAAERVRAAILRRGLTDTETAAKLSDNELYEFLFLPGFSLKDTVTEISGRGVGLDAVHNMVKQVRGSIRVSSHPGRGTRFQLHLPLTVSVVRTLLVEIDGESYAFPLAYIARTLSLAREEIEQLEGHQHFRCDGRQVGLVSARQLFADGDPAFAGDRLAVIVIGDQDNQYAVVVDRFLGVRELVVQPIDPRLGKLKDISAAALLEDGTPVLIVDVDDLIRSVEKLVASGSLGQVQYRTEQGPQRQRKRVLVVDDSLTVRELERKLIESGGFEVEVAVDGVDGWNAVRAGQFHLVVTDVDMPRMDGVELVGLIRKDPRLQSLPVMIVSYKDREEDRQRGLEAGADFYLTKGSFQDESLLQTVVDLIGEAHS